MTDTWNRAQGRGETHSRCREGTEPTAVLGLSPEAQGHTEGAHSPEAAEPLPQPGALCREGAPASIHLPVPSPLHKASWVNRSWPALAGGIFSDSQAPSTSVNLLPHLLTSLSQHPGRGPGKEDIEGRALEVRELRQAPWLQQMEIFAFREIRLSR